MNEIIKTLVKKGFVKGHRKILSDAEIEELINFLVKHREEFNKHNNSKNDPGRLGKRSMMFCDIVGKNKRIDEILNKIISNEEVQITLQKVLGDNFLLTNPIARFNHPEDKGLGIHQDAPGEAGLLFLVNDQPDGSTIMLPGSHLIYGRIGGLVSWCSLRLLKITRFFF